MKKILKFMGYFMLILLFAVSILIAYIKMALPNVGKAEDLKIEITPERVERGKYLANCVTICMDCHSTRDWTKFSGPITPGTFGNGGEKFAEEFGFPGVYFSKNITPYGIKDYTDGELLRVITTGVNKKGEAMFPIMPYPYYGKMDKEDIYSIIAYIRTLPSIQKEVPNSKSNFPMNIIINTIPEKASFEKIPPKTNQLEYGRYMVNASGCAECHTQVDKGQIIPELRFSGGREFIISKNEIVRSANITSDKETGIGSWTEDQFINKFKSYSDSSGYMAPTVGANDFKTIMPWTMYANMTHEDLSAIYHYLFSLKSIPNKVVTYSNTDR